MNAIDNDVTKFVANSSQNSFVNSSGVKTIDAIYGPWESIDAFKSNFKEVFVLEEGELSVVTIGIAEDGKVVEYWNPDASANFVKKSQEIDLDALDERYVRAEEIDEETVDVLAPLKEMLNDCYVDNVQLKLSCKDAASKITLKHDLEISSTLLVNNENTKTLNLNGKHIANASIDILYTEEGKSITSNVDAITVSSGSTLTINGGTNPETIGKVTTVSGGASPLYANGGTIIVNGGLYESLQGLDAGKGYSLVFADGQGKIEINDGYFIVNGNPDESKYQYILNCKDPDKEAVITVKGGYFYNWSPAAHDNNGHEEVVIPAGYEVEALEDTTFFGHEGTWYHVIPAEA